MFTAAILGAWRSLTSSVRSLVRADPGRPTADRWVLESDILPGLGRRDDVGRVLFVGCARYTRSYDRFFPHAEYWTIDPSRRRRRWGAEHHIVGRLEHLRRYVPAGSFDAIVCNGVLGWGLNRRGDAEAAFTACHGALRDGGELIVGWNDVAPHNRIRPESLASLRRFELVPLAGRSARELRIAGANRHVYLRYLRVGEAAEQGRSVVGPSGASSASGRQLDATHSA